MRQTINYKYSLDDLWTGQTDNFLHQISLFNTIHFQIMVPTNKYVHYYYIINLLLEMGLKPLGGFKIASILEQIMTKSMTLPNFNMCLL